MPSLSQTSARFRTLFTVIDNGSGLFHGMIDEPDQGMIPPSAFTIPRRLLQVEPTIPVSAGMVVRDISGTVFLLGHHGVSESRGGQVFRNFRMFESPQQFGWQTRTKMIDPVTRLPADTGLSTKTLIWGIYEPTPEMFDRAVKTQFETARFVTNRPIKTDDIIDGKRVMRVDEMLGLYLANLG